MEALLPVANVLGRLMMFFALAFLGPIACALLFGDGMAIHFVLALLVTFGIGIVLAAATRRYYRELKIRDGFLLVTLSWALMAAVASMPLHFAYPELTFTNAYFESMSALTTTGATVLVGLDGAPPSINLWRHELQWLGGMGIIVLAVAILPLLGVGGMQLYKAEMAGPMKESRLTERIADTAKALWIVYAGLTVACLLALRLAGMSWFEALCHAFSALSLGGFSTRDASIGAWNSPAIEAVLTAFMVVAGINFATHFTVWRARSARAYLADEEAKAYVLLLIFSCLFMAGYLVAHGTYESWGTSLRHAIFNVVSIATTTGYASVDFNAWPFLAPLVMLLLSSITASSGSTGGGIKMVRTLILYKQARRELHKLLHPNIADLIKLGRVVVPNKVAFSVLGFIFLYFMTVTVMTFLMLASGLDFVSSFSAVVACINNMGPGLNVVGPASNYAALTGFQKWICVATMLLGRLEILSVIVIFTRHFWRK
jgi:trk system potassium uptake protein